MKLPEYVSSEEVKRVCRELNFRDWVELTDPTVSTVEASTILNIENTQEMDIPLDDFQQGLEVELEHGTIYEDANVTNNHPILTGKIVSQKTHEDSIEDQKEIARLVAVNLGEAISKDIKNGVAEGMKQGIAEGYLEINGGN